MSAMNLRATLAAVRRHPLSVIVPVVVDSIALFVFAALFSSLFVAATSQISVINEILGMETAAFVASGGTVAVGDAALAEQEAVLAQQTSVLILNLALIFFIAYVLFTLSQTVDWWLAHRAARGQRGHAGASSDLGVILVRMLSLNALWLGMMLCVLVGSGYLGSASSVPVPIVGPGFYVALAIIAVVALAYFMTVSHAFILQATPLRTSLRSSVARAARHGVPFCVIALGIAAFYLLMPPVSAWRYGAGIMCFLLLLAWIAVGRVWLAVTATAEARS